MLLTICIAAGFVLDLIFGDPAVIPHPIIYIGKLISFFDRRLYSDKHTFFRGILLTAAVCVISAGIPFFAADVCRRVSVWLYCLLETFWVFQILACKSLYTESMKVYHALKSDDIQSARRLLSYIVGRDTAELSREEIICAAVETVAENTSDGITAPLMFIGAGGAAPGFFYKAVNTLDSMVGYKNDRYLIFGRASARLDDILNFIPSRVCALLMIAACVVCRLDTRGAARIFIRDRRNHLSPNSAQTESVIAGALGIRLGGTHDYFGKPVEKPTIGDDTRCPETEDILRVNRVMLVTSVFSALLVCAVRICITGVSLWL